MQQLTYGIPTSLDILALHGPFIGWCSNLRFISRFETGFSGAHQQPILATPTPSAVAGELAAAWRDGSGSWGGGAFEKSPALSFYLNFNFKVEEGTTAAASVVK